MAKQKENWKQEENKWYQEAQSIAKTLNERPAFSYSPGSDPLYQAAKEQTLTQGRRAMEDTMGKAAGLTGGYASSYAQSLGTQAYDRQLARLSELLPDYYAQARTAYDRQTEALQDELSRALGFYDKDYQVWLDRQAAQERQESADAKAAQWEKEFQEGRSRWAAEQELNERKFAAQQEQALRDAALAAQKLADQQTGTAASQAASAAERERSYAYRMAMQALQQGVAVSDSLLKTAGIDKTYAESIRRYYAALRQR